MNGPPILNPSWKTAS